MHGDGFGCLHTEDISGHKIEGLPFLRENTRRCTYAPPASSIEIGFYPIFFVKNITFLAHVIFLLYLCTRNSRWGVCIHITGEGAYIIKAFANACFGLIET